MERGWYFVDNDYLFAEDMDTYDRGRDLVYRVNRELDYI